jgi:uncharacterized protein (TIGR02996 family)
MNEKDLLAAVIAAPQDDRPRLAYADWCDKHDPLRGEFIRAQCEIEKLPQNDPRYGPLCSRAIQLREAHQKRWAAPLADLTFFAHFQRGFPEIVGVKVEQFAEVAERLFATTPVATISFCCSDIKDYLPGILACPHLRQLRKLSLTGLRLNDEHIVRLAETPYLSNLDTLEVGNNLFGARGVSALVQSPHLAKLTSLSLYKTPLGPEGCEALARECRLTELDDLNLYSASVGDDGAVAIGASARLSKLTNLSLGRGINGYESIGPPIKDKGAAALANARHLSSLVQLNLENNYIGDKGAIAIAHSENLSSLVQLNLKSNAIDAAGARALAGAHQFTNLRYLDLTNNILGKEGVQAFASSLLLAHLKRIGLSGNSIYSDRYVEYTDWDGSIAGGGNELMGTGEIHKVFAFPDDVKLF